MIESITGKARFRPNDETIVVDFQPGTGITAVVGPNGVGKTFTASESIRYLFFGVKALRSTLSTIAELDLIGFVQIHGERYKIRRSLKTASVIKGADTLAVGAEEVTKKVIELLGYGLDVFDVCNSALQKKTDSLGELTPGKRKEMIDNILRITDVKTVEKACREEATALKRDAETMQRLLPVVGEKPKEPKGYVQSEKIRETRDAARLVVSKRDELMHQLVSPSYPDEPTGARVDDAQIAVLEQEDEARRQLVAQRAQLEAAAVAEPAPLSAEAIDAAVARFEWEQEVQRRGPKPVLADHQIEEYILAWQRREGDEGELVTCPKCQHEFRTRPELPPEPPYSLSQLREERRRAQNWSTELPPEPANLHGSLSYPEASKMRELLRKASEAADAYETLQALPEPGPDRSAELRELRNQQAQWGAYDSLILAAKLQEQANERIQAELDALPLPVDVDGLSEALLVALEYEKDLQRWTEDNNRFKQLSKEIEAKLTSAEDFLEGNKELGAARAELKAFLAPTLSREASELLFDMTNGKLSALIIDEDMAITVDSKPIETLSGAGKTVANLALRIALTKVITGTAFPVFIGDEMDGDLDVERREATAQALVSLKKHLKQIILITHRDVDIADQVIDLGEK